MATETIQVDSIGGYKAGVTPTLRAMVNLETDASANAADVGCVRSYSENDQGVITGAPFLFAPETDIDYRLRMSSDALLDTECFNYTAQNTGKHNMLATTLVPSFTLGAFNTNPTSLTTTAAGVQLRTYATFPVVGTATTAFDIELGFNAAPAANVIVEFGGGLLGAAVATTPIDGVFFRLTSAGLAGIMTYNGTETSTGIMPVVNGGAAWTYTLNQKYQFIIYITQREVQFWINDGTGAVLYGRMQTPAGNSQPCASSALPMFLRQYHSGAAGAALSVALGSYSVRLGGPDLTDVVAVNSNGLHGAYQGLSGGTMGSSIAGTVTTGSIVPPTAAVPTNTTAALLSGLGGTLYETVSLAAAVDGIILSFQVPALPTAVGATYVPQRRLRVNGITLASFVQTVIAGGPWCARYYLAFGHTAVSLQTAEAATTKAARRVMLPFVQAVTAAQAVGTLVNQTTHIHKFVNPIYVEPGQFLQLVTTHTGTVGTTGTIAHQIQFDYSWE